MPPARIDQPAVGQRACVYFNDRCFFVAEWQRVQQGNVLEVRWPGHAEHEKAAIYGLVTAPWSTRRPCSLFQRRMCAGERARPKRPRPIATTPPFKHGMPDLLHQVGHGEFLPVPAPASRPATLARGIWPIALGQSWVCRCAKHLLKDEGSVGGEKALHPFFTAKNLFILPVPVPHRGLRRGA